MEVLEVPEVPGAHELFLKFLEVKTIRILRAKECCHLFIGMLMADADPKSLEFNFAPQLEYVRD